MITRIVVEFEFGIVRFPLTINGSEITVSFAEIIVELFAIQELLTQMRFGIGGVGDEQAKEDGEGEGVKMGDVDRMGDEVCG